MKEIRISCRYGDRDDKRQFRLLVYLYKRPSVGIYRG